jgi:hypothetical protein
MNDWREIYTYDSSGNEILCLSEGWGGTQWVNFARYTYTYDFNGYKTSYLYESWDDSQWVNNSRLIYTYDSNGNITSYLSEHWTSSQWVNDWEMTYTYYYSILTDIAGSRGVSSGYFLLQNYPNPFNPATTIKYSIPNEADFVSLKVYNPLGQEVATLVNEEKPSGTYEVKFDGGNLTSGVYFYSLQTNTGFIATKKLLLLK